MSKTCSKRGITHSLTMMISFTKLSPKYALASVAVVGFLISIYGISNGDYQSKTPTPKQKHHKKNMESHINVIPVEDEYMTQSHDHLLKQRRKGQQLLAGIHSKTMSHSSQESEYEFEFRIVHLDLKGAPPRVSYFEGLFPFLKDQGVNGILLEYEDMFPYSGPFLDDVSAYNAYTVSDIKEILRLARENNLEVIPLIQTFGHLEFFLKLKQNKDMREVYMYPGSICPSHNNTKLALHSMIDQVVSLHPNLRYLHIGCDEVYQLGKCERCIQKMKHHEWTRGQLFLNHVLDVAKYIRSTYPEVMPLVWDDMFRSLTYSELSDSGVASWVEPVVWNYHQNVLMHINPDIWAMYAHTFKNVWIASAFKGATTPDQLLTNFTYHLENHMSWMSVVEQFKQQILFRGIMMTGWQRYDHFAVLCELFPVGLPSLVLNLFYIQNYKHVYMIDTSAKFHDLLQCSITYPPHGDSLCSFPGARLFRVAQRLYLLRNELDNPRSGLNNPVARGWVNYHNIKWNFSNPNQVETATVDIDRFKMNIVLLKEEFRQAAAEIYDRYTVEEWIETNIEPLEKTLNELWMAREQLMSRLDWPRRPLHSNNISDQNMS